MFAITVNPDPAPLQSLLDTLGLVVTQVLSWLTAVCSLICAKPLLILTIGFLVLGATIGILGRCCTRS